MSGPKKVRPLPAVVSARAALTRGPLVRRARHWQFRRRLFSNATVAALVAAGEAVRQGDRVEARQ
jgi:hypothetical protein